MKIKNLKRGQATMEMIFVLPILFMLAAGLMFIVYAAWQGIRVQQAANLAARVQGQEKVGGGPSVNDIEAQNGHGDNFAAGQVDEDPTKAGRRFIGQSQNNTNTATVYGRLRDMVRKMFGNAKNQVYVPAPRQGQNVDKIRVIRVINLPSLPFARGENNQGIQLKLEGEAYGGEDPYMYSLPRWGKTASNDEPEWAKMVRQSKDNPEQ